MRARSDKRAGIIVLSPWLTPFLYTYTIHAVYVPGAQHQRAKISRVISRNKVLMKFDNVKTFPYSRISLNIFTFDYSHRHRPGSPLLFWIIIKFAQNASVQIQFSIVAVAVATIAVAHRDDVMPTLCRPIATPTNSNAIRTRSPCSNQQSN